MNSYGGGKQEPRPWSQIWINIWVSISSSIKLDGVSPPYGDTVKIQGDKPHTVLGFYTFSAPCGLVLPVTLGSLISGEFLFVCFLNELSPPSLDHHDKGPLC